MSAIRLGRTADRATLIVEGRAIDVEKRASGAFPSDLMKIYEHWDAFCRWARTQTPENDDPLVSDIEWQCPVPPPSAVYAIGLNYKDHAEEAGLEIPRRPMVFTKFPSCITGPTADIPLTSNRVDWEAELVLVIGQGGRNITVGDAMNHVAGYSIGQDISDRRQQFSDRPPQFNLGKSATHFGPIGPVVVTLDAFDDPDAIPLRCEINGVEMQSSTTANMIFPVSELVSFLSKWVELFPGDLIFTGTPAGVGSVRDPRRYLVAGDVITTTIPGIGTMTNTCVAK